MRETIAATSAASAAGLLALGAGLAPTLPGLAAGSLLLAAVWALLCRAALHLPG
jgi:hypothetical protein